jgi:hypothetical protein
VARFWGGGNIDARAARKKTAWLQMKTGSLNWHNWPIFGTRNVIRAKHMPQHHVSIFNFSISTRPLRQTRPTCMLIRVIASRISLVGPIRRHP